MPLYRTKYLYIHRIVTKGWVAKGVVCTGLMGDGQYSGAFLVASGIANATDAAAGKKFKFAPCLVFPSLLAPGGPWELAKKHFETLDQKDVADFLGHVGRR